MNFATVLGGSSSGRRIPPFRPTSAGVLRVLTVGAPSIFFGGCKKSLFFLHSFVVDDFSPPVLNEENGNVSWRFEEVPGLHVHAGHHYVVQRPQLAEEVFFDGFVVRQVYRDDSERT